MTYKEQEWPKLGVRTLPALIRQLPPHYAATQASALGPRRPDRPHPVLPPLLTPQRPAAHHFLAASYLYLSQMLRVGGVSRGLANYLNKSGLPAPYLYRARLRQLFRLLRKRLRPRGVLRLPSPPTSAVLEGLINYRSFTRYISWGGGRSPFLDRIRDISSAFMGASTRLLFGYLRGLLPQLAYLAGGASIMSFLASLAPSPSPSVWVRGGVLGIQRSDQILGLSTMSSVLLVTPGRSKLLNQFGPGGLSLSRGTVLSSPVYGLSSQYMSRGPIAKKKMSLIPVTLSEPRVRSYHVGGASSWAGLHLAPGAARSACKVTPLPLFIV